MKNLNSFSRLKIPLILSCMACKIATQDPQQTTPFQTVSSNYQHKLLAQVYASTDEEMDVLKKGRIEDIFTLIKVPLEKKIGKKPVKVMLDQISQSLTKVNTERNNLQANQILLPNWLKREEFKNFLKTFKLKPSAVNSSDFADSGFQDKIEVNKEAFNALEALHGTHNEFHTLIILFYNMMNHFVDGLSEPLSNQDKYPILHGENEIIKKKNKDEIKRLIIHSFHVLLSLQKLIMQTGENAEEYAEKRVIAYFINYLGDLSNKMLGGDFDAEKKQEKITEIKTHFNATILQEFFKDFITEKGKSSNAIGAEKLVTDLSAIQAINDKSAFGDKGKLAIQERKYNSRGDIGKFQDLSSLSPEIKKLFELAEKLHVIKKDDAKDVYQWHNKTDSHYLLEEVGPISDPDDVKIETTYLSKENYYKLISYIETIAFSKNNTENEILKDQICKLQATPNYKLHNKILANASKELVPTITIEGETIEKIEIQIEDTYKIWLYDCTRDISKLIANYIWGEGTVLGHLKKKAINKALQQFVSNIAKTNIPTVFMWMLLFFPLLGIVIPQMEIPIISFIIKRTARYFGFNKNEIALSAMALLFLTIEYFKPIWLKNREQEYSASVKPVMTIVTLITAVWLTHISFSVMKRTGTIQHKTYLNLGTFMDATKQLKITENASVLTKLLEAIGCNVAYFLL